jgi:dihydrodipicolinate synthase/N-acetylneuraminate lyase
MNKKKYTGVIVPAVTPFTENYKIDSDAVKKMFDMFYQHNISPFILGTTGECASISLQLKKDYINIAAQHKKDNTLLYAGIGSNVFDESIELAKYAAANKVDVLVATLPSYYTLTENQMKQYFITLADQVSLPLFIYNIPATTHMSIPLHIIDELSKHNNIVGLKDSERSEERMMQALELWKNNESFHYVIGWAAKSADALLNEADGLVPSTANINPEIYKQMIDAFTNKDKDEMYKMQQLSDEYGALYQTNKTLGESLKALKTLMKQKGLCQDYMMSPL